MRSVVAGLLGLLVVARAARADEPAPQLELQAVQASNSGGQVDSQFAGLKRRFAHSGFSYSSYKLVGSHTGELKPGAPVELELAHQRAAKVALVGLKGPGVYEVHLTAPGGHDLDTALYCGGSGIVELDRDPSNPDHGSSLYLTYRLRCAAPSHGEAPHPAAAVDGGS